MDPSELNGARHEFLLREYQRISSLIEQEVNEGDKRAQYFLTLVSLAGGLTLYLYSLDIRDIATYIIILMVILLILGILTQNRLATRTIQLHHLRQLLKKIQSIYSKQYPEVSEYFTSQQDYFKQPNEHEYIKEFKRRLRGSWPDVVITCNSIITSVLLILIFSDSLLTGSYIAIVVGLSIIFFILYNKLYNIMKRKLFPFQV